jgi:hypothetical protein
VAPVAAPTISATQRVALPQAPAAEPSGLKMRMNTSAPVASGASSTISWSQPIPVRRSASALIRAAVSGSLAGRPSSTTKSLPAPCILKKPVDMARA